MKFRVIQVMGIKKNQPRRGVYIWLGEGRNVGGEVLAREDRKKTEIGDRKELHLTTNQRVGVDTEFQTVGSSGETMGCDVPSPLQKSR